MLTVKPAIAKVVMLTPKICSADAEGHKGLNTEMKSWRLSQHAQRGPDPCIGQCRLSYNVCHLLQVVERTEGDGRENDLGGVLKRRQGAAQASKEQEDADADPDCSRESCWMTTSLKGLIESVPFVAGG